MSIEVAETKSLIARQIDLYLTHPTGKRILQGVVMIGMVVSTLPAIGALITIYYINAHNDPKALDTPVVIPWVLFAVAVYSSASSILKHLMDRREKELKALEAGDKTTAEDALLRGLTLGANAAYTEWSGVALKHRYAIEAAKNRRFIGGALGPKKESDHDPVRKHLIAILEVLNQQFPDVERFCATLVMVCPEAEQLWVVMVEPGRARTRKVTPRPYPLEKGDSGWGMSIAVERKQMVYSTQLPPPPPGEDREYNTVLNFPLFTPAGNVFAVVNIDSPSADACGENNTEETKKRLDQVEDFAQPILESLGWLLMDQTFFPRHRETIP